MLQNCSFLFNLITYIGTYNTLKNMVYRSKIGWNILAPVIILIGGLCVYYIINQFWEALIVMLLVTSFVAYLYNTTYYTIKGGILNVHCGFFINTDIDIVTIKSVTETNSVLSAPALSLDRIEVFYNRYDSIIISPPDKIAFIAELKAINNSIEVKLKDKN
jgi:TctA family transporter